MDALEHLGIKSKEATGLMFLPYSRNPVSPHTSHPLQVDRSNLIEGTHDPASTAVQDMGVDHRGLHIPMP